MYRSILVPLDGSPFGEHALPVAIGIARRTGATLTLVRVLPRDAPPVAWAPGLPLDRVEAQHPRTVGEAAAQEYLDTLVARVRRAGAVDASARLVTGEVVPALLAQEAEVAADLIVLTTHGRGGVRRAMLGSVADTLVRAADVPVLAVRPRATTPVLHEEAPMARILLPLDGSANDEAAIRQAERLADAAGAELLLLRVVSPAIHHDRPTAVQVDRDDLRRLKAEAHAYLTPIRERLARREIAATTVVLVDDEPEEAIVRHAEAAGVDLIAMATRGLGGVERLMKGSVADRVLQGAAADVLLYRA